MANDVLRAIGPCIQKKLDKNGAFPGLTRKKRTLIKEIRGDKRNNEEISGKKTGHRLKKNIKRLTGS